MITSLQCCTSTFIDQPPRAYCVVRAAGNAGLACAALNIAHHASHHVTPNTTVLDVYITSPPVYITSPRTQPYSTCTSVDCTLQMPAPGLRCHHQVSEIHSEGSTLPPPAPPRRYSCAFCNGMQPVDGHPGRVRQWPTRDRALLRILSR